MQVEQEILNMLCKQSTQLDNISETMHKHTEKIDNLTEIVQEHTEKIDNLTEKMDESKIFKDTVIEKLEKHDERLELLEKHAVFIEEQLTNEIPALFCGYMAHQEKQEEFNQNLEKVNNITIRNSVKISILEDKVEEHTSQLKRLTS